MIDMKKQSQIRNAHAVISFSSPHPIHPTYAAICGIEDASGDTGDFGESAVLSLLLDSALFDEEPPKGQRYLQTLDRLAGVGVLVDVGVVGATVSTGLIAVSIGLGASATGLSTTFGAGADGLTFSTDLMVTVIGRWVSLVGLVSGALGTMGSAEWGIIGSADFVLISSGPFTATGSRALTGSTAGAETGSRGLVTTAGSSFDSTDSTAGWAG
ncbi:uncharacterized protein LY89DRAFT_54614 [Mollisia scopiformis]|uniref:Uncharacterized protein n=1 Tax=Mollisia scopiformis TaxID=149040 RepID=A0A194XBG0_MOLSC|nr:uncharacterized protein LY89DRAFT_54614 [Mollisia scopiformis]KUJ17499.1 hypothetical protein LY89DRAFT_54614 [Mollisia scopiformis]